MRASGQWSAKVWIGGKRVTRDLETTNKEVARAKMRAIMLREPKPAASELDQIARTDHELRLQRIERALFSDDVIMSEEVDLQQNPEDIE